MKLWHVYAYGASLTVGVDIVIASDTFKAVLCGSAYEPSDAHETYADITSELPTVGGYTQGGLTLTNVSAGAGLSFTADDLTWTSANVIGPAASVVIYDSTASDALIFWGRLPAVVRRNGETLKIVSTLIGNNQSFRLPHRTIADHVNGAREINSNVFKEVEIKRAIYEFSNGRTFNEYGN